MNPRNMYMYGIIVLVCAATFVDCIEEGTSVLFMIHEDFEENRNDHIFLNNLLS